MLVAGPDLCDGSFGLAAGSLSLPAGGSRPAPGSAAGEARSVRWHFWWQLSAGTD